MSVPNHALRVPIKLDADIVLARQNGRALALGLGFSGSAPTVIAAAISEIARNIVDHAQEGEIIISAVQQNGRTGLQVVARDIGPGIKDIEQAMEYGYSSGKGLGVGLPGVKMLMDDFEIRSKAGEGTEVTVRKWLD